VNRLPVVDEDGRPVDILTRGDVVGALVQRLRGSLQQEKPARLSRRPAMVPD
jgi:CBS-domain-containing membrane protein